MLNLDTILASPFEVEIGGKVYSIEDPGMESITKMISMSVKVKKDHDKITDFLDHMRSMTSAIPDDVFMRLSSKQVIELMKAMGQHFLSGTDSEGKQEGPLSQPARDEK